jgi:hypothetical protein
MACQVAATRANSLLVTQRSYQAMKSSLVTVASGWTLAHSLPRALLAQDGAALEIGSGGIVEASYCWVSASLQLPGHLLLGWGRLKEVHIRVVPAGLFIPSSAPGKGEAVRQGEE